MRVCVCVCVRVCACVRVHVCVAVALPMINSLELIDITHSTMRVRWRTAAGASGYMILYAPLTEGEPADEKEVGKCVCACARVRVRVTHFRDGLVCNVTPGGRFIAASAFADS